MTLGRSEELSVKKTKFSEGQIESTRIRLAARWSRTSYRKASSSEATFYNPRKKYGGLLPSEMKRLEQLEEENNRLKRDVTDLTLDKSCCRTPSRQKLRSLLGSGR